MHEYENRYTLSGELKLTDATMPYPRVIAHRGFSTIAPENSLPAYGAAVALGADEIELDLRFTKDGEIISIHDPNLERISDGTGLVEDYTYEELLQFDVGAKYSDKFRGLRILKFEEILLRFARRVIMNVHLKTVDNKCEYDPEVFAKILALIDKYNCREYVYFMSGNPNVNRVVREMAPDIQRACGGKEEDLMAIVEDAIEFQCQKVQFFKPYVNQEMIDKAHANGIICNLFWADDPKEAVQYLDMGIDAILTNEYYIVAQVIEEYRHRGRDYH